MEDCIVYLVFQLRKNGFEVRFTWPNLLYISWRHTEGEYLSRQNPIVQAMVPEPPPKPTLASQKKSKAQISQPTVTFAQPRAFNDDINLINQRNTPGGQEQALSRMMNTPGSFGTTPITATPRSAAEYKPPDSFIQNLERPGPDRQPSKAQPQGSGNILTDLWNF
jgi:hypothetical protein